MRQFLGNNIQELGIGTVVVLLTLQIVMPFVGAPSSASADTITGTQIMSAIHEAANQYQVQTSRIEQLNQQQCESDKTAMAAHSQLVAGLADLAKNLALLNRAAEDLRRSTDRIERNAGP
jgi:hypothetical protein